MARRGSETAVTAVAIELPFDDRPLADAAGTIAVRGGSFLRRLAAFLGPGWLVAVGYMDPGNWATSLAAGSAYGYELLWIAFVSNLMAVVLQGLAIRLGIATGRDLARACRDYLPAWTTVPLWLAAELAIMATDVAEVVGTAIGLQLLFGLPLAVGVLLTTFDVFLVLALQVWGFRRLEAFVVALLAIITACFVGEIVLARPDWAATLKGFVPQATLFTDPQRLYLALGILGATVMPHNLYLHSAVVQTRAYGGGTGERRDAIRLATVDSSVALTFAFAVNAAILILAAAAFNAGGRTDVAELGRAHDLLMPLLGAAVAPSLFAVALIACGLNSTLTATLTGQTVMEGFVRLRVRPWVRRLVTRALAVVPAIVVTFVAGERATAELLVASQVVLSLQLPFAIVPLVWFTADRRRLGALVAPRWATAAAALVAVVVVALNLKFAWDFFVGA